jgi:hypothetical protein
MICLFVHKVGAAAGVFPLGGWAATKSLMYMVVGASSLALGTTPKNGSS